MTAQPDLFGGETAEPVSPRVAHGEFLDTDLISWAPCGCWMAVMVETADFAENAKRVAEFVRDAERSGGGRVERIPHSRVKEIFDAEKARGKKVGCDHDPKWGGLVPTHRECPRCWKDVKIRQDGKLSAHKHGWSTCSQEPYERAGSAGSEAGS